MKKLFILRGGPCLRFGANIESTWGADYLTSHAGEWPVLNFLNGGIFAKPIGDKFAAERSHQQNEYFKLLAHFSSLSVVGNSVILEFNPQCQLPDTVSAGVTEASSKNLPE